MPNVWDAMKKHQAEQAAKTADRPQAVAEAEAPPAPRPAPQRPPEPPPDPPAAVPGTTPYRPWESPYRRLHKNWLYTDLQFVADLVARIVASEGPISLRLTTERVRMAFGFGRAGERIRKRVLDAARASQGRGEIRIAGGPGWPGPFLWPADLITAPVRTPEKGSAPRRIEDVPLEEIAEAAVLIVRGAGGIADEALVRQVSRLLGYERTGSEISDRVREALGRLDSETRVVLRDGLYYPNP